MSPVALTASGLISTMAEAAPLRILLLGAQGQLGHALAQALPVMPPPTTTTSAERILADCAGVLDGVLR